MWQRLAWLALAGALGTMARYLVSGFVHDVCGAKYPWGTLAVNALGCFLFGVAWSLAEDRFLINVQTRLIVLTGFMGAFTTFSTFAFETGQMLRDSQWWLAVSNVAGQNVLGLVCVLLGLVVSRFI